MGFSNDIYSFEPHSESYESLLALSSRDSKWHCYNYGFGDSVGKATLNIAEETGFNSILIPKEFHTNKPARFSFNKTEQINLSCIDIFWKENQLNGKKVYLKIDTQGYDYQILKGASTCLKTVNAVQVELSLTHLYKGQPDFEEPCQYLYDNGFQIYGVWPGFRDPNQHCLFELNAIFIKLEPQQI